MRKINFGTYLLFVYVVVCVHTKAVSKSALFVQLASQKTQELYYENGFLVEFTHPSLWKERIQFEAGYISTRLGSALNSEAFLIDEYLIATSLHFRPQRKFDPYLQIRSGIWHHDPGVSAEWAQEFVETEAILALAGGFQWNIVPKWGGLDLGLGYQVLEKSDLQFPLFYHIGLRFNLGARFWD